MYDGWLEKFDPITLLKIAEVETQSWPEACCESSYDGSILIGGKNYENIGTDEVPIFRTPINIHDPGTLEVTGSYTNGVIPIALSTIDDLLVEEHRCIQEEDSYTGYILEGRGLIITDLATGLELYDWSPLPDIVRGSCVEANSGRWFGVTYDPYAISTTTLWMICDLTDPDPVVVDSFNDTRISFMEAIPHGSDQIRLIGINLYTDSIFSYDTPSNASPFAEFESNPPAGDAPLLVDFMNCSYDCDGEIVEIQADWDNDGTVDEYIQGSPSYLTHTFTETGLHELVLTVIDDGGASSQWTGSIEVL